MATKPYKAPSKTPTKKGKKCVSALLALAFSASCLAHDKPKPPKPTPPPPTTVPAEQPRGGGGNSALPILIAAGLIGFVIYKHESEKEQSKVTLRPVSDGKGLTASMEYRF